MSKNWSPSLRVREAMSVEIVPKETVPGAAVKSASPMFPPMSL
jgi:hypothetical protein